MADVLVIVPQPDEYRAVHEVLKATGGAPKPDAQDGLFTIANDQGTAPFSVAVGYLDSMYNFPSLSGTERLLAIHQPRYAFLVGSACGNPSKVEPFDVVLSVPCVVYLGSGRLVDGVPGPLRHFTYPVGEHMGARLRDFFVYRTVRHSAWRRRSHRVMTKLADTGLSIDPALATRSQVKHGIIASDDYVLEWSNRDLARAYWRSNRDDVHAYDMESAGFAYACHSRGSRLDWAVIRGVSDHGVQGQTKGHLEAAAVAATCLESLLRFLLHPGTSPRDATFNPRTYDWPCLRQLLEDEQSRFSRVYKGRFIKQILGGSELHVSALAFAISRGAVREYEVPGSPDRSPETAIRLDTDLDRWVSLPSA